MTRESSLPQDDGKIMLPCRNPIFQGFLWVSFQGHEPAVEEEENWKGEFSPHGFVNQSPTSPDYFLK